MFLQSVINKTLNHSSAQAFYLCSCIFIGILLLNENVLIYRPKIGLIVFITLFYAMINHFIVCLCKHEDFSEYARGRHIIQIINFTIITCLLLLFWFTSILYIFISMCWKDSTIILHHIFIVLFIECIILVTLFAEWIIIMFILKIKDNNKQCRPSEQKSDNDHKITYDKNINIDIRQ